MYLVVDDQVKVQIGIIEIPMENLPSIVDEDDDLDPERIPDPILYDFVTKEYLKKFENNENLEEDYGYFCANTCVLILVVQL